MKGKELALFTLFLFIFLGIAGLFIKDYVDKTGDVTGELIESLNIREVGFFDSGEIVEKEEVLNVLEQKQIESQVLEELKVNPSEITLEPIVQESVIKADEVNKVVVKNNTINVVEKNNSIKKVPIKTVENKKPQQTIVNTEKPATSSADNNTADKIMSKITGNNNKSKTTNVEQTQKSETPSKTNQTPIKNDTKSATASKEESNDIKLANLRSKLNEKENQYNDLTNKIKGFESLNNEDDYKELIEQYKTVRNQIKKEISDIKKEIRKFE